MKKSFYRVVILLIILVIGIANLAYASESVNISFNKINDVKIGDTFEVKVSIDGTSKGIKGIQGKLKYDNTVLEYIGNNCLKSGWEVTGYNDKTGIFLLEVSDISNLNGFIYDKCEIVSFKFKVKVNCKKEETDIQISDLVLSDDNGAKAIGDSTNIKIKKADSENSGGSGSSTGETQSGSGRN